MLSRMFLVPSKLSEMLICSSTVTCEGDLLHLHVVRQLFTSYIEHVKGIWP